MKITKIKIREITPDKGHIGFASLVIDNWLFLNNIAIFKRLDSDRIRLVFPEKKMAEKKVSLFYPLTKESYFELEEEVSKYIKL